MRGRSIMSEDAENTPSPEDLLRLNSQVRHKSEVGNRQRDRPLERGCPEANDKMEEATGGVKEGEGDDGRNREDRTTHD